VGTAPVDSHYPKSGVSKVYVHDGEPMDAMLNQTNIGNNNNKFYKLQVIDEGGRYVLHTRWGRVGEPGQTQQQSSPNAAGAVKMFEQKFKDKSAQKWPERDVDFVPPTGKYTLLVMDHDAKPGAAAAAASAPADHAAPTLPCTLDPASQELVSLITNKNTFNAAMVALQVDVQRMPLGALSQTTIDQGNKVLEDLEKELNKPKPSDAQLQALSSRYYTVIPTAVGRQAPPVFRSLAMVQEKYDLLAVLSDIALAQTMQATTKAKTPKKVAAVPHPLDLAYESLKCELDLLSQNTTEYKAIAQFVNDTSHGAKLANVWRVERAGDKGVHFFDNITNRKLLWHGTNAAVVAAILGSGLRIMPHSGGRVGRGIYLASEQRKSAGYVRSAKSPMTGKNLGVMFLVEAALGNEHHINRDDSSLTRPPKGFDSVVAQGHTEPPDATTFTLEGRKVTVPQGKPVSRSQWSNSSFSNSEYLIYNERQHKLRYVLTFSWDW